MSKRDPTSRQVVSPPRGKRLYTGDEAQPTRTLGAPRQHTRLGKYETEGGITIDCKEVPLADPTEALEALIDHLDAHRGCLFESSYDFPGRYARWTMGFADPPIVLEARGRVFDVCALNRRGQLLLPVIAAALRACPSLESLENSDTVLHGTVLAPEQGFAEEDRSRQHSIFSVVRALQALFRFDEEPQLGLYGAFGYDLTFQFESVKMHQQRDEAQRDLVLFLPDEILVIDILSNSAWKLCYEFSIGGATTAGLPHEGAARTFVPKAAGDILRRRDHKAGEFAQKVTRAKEEFKVGAVVQRQ